MWIVRLNLTILDLHFIFYFFKENKTNQRLRLQAKQIAFYLKSDGFNMQFIIFFYVFRSTKPELFNGVQYHTFWSGGHSHITYILHISCIPNIYINKPTLSRLLHQFILWRKLLQYLVWWRKNIRGESFL